MADPRLAVKFDGLHAQYATFKGDGTQVNYTAGVANGCSYAGLAVFASADDTCDLVDDGEFVLGKLIRVEIDDIATVQVAGFCELAAGTGATLTRGAAIVGDLLIAAEGYIRVSDGSTAAEIKAQRGHIINNGTTTAVVVQL